MAPTMKPPRMTKRWPKPKAKAQGVGKGKGKGMGMGMTAALAVGLACLPWGSLGCAATGVRGSETAPADAMADLPPRAGAPLVLIAMPPSANFQDVRRSLITEIQRDFNVATLLITSSTGTDELGSAISRLNPVCIVLMNNNAVGLYREYQQAHLNAAKFPPSVVVMASFVDELQRTLINATGITYEVPGVTAFVHLRSVIRAPVKRVGVVYRPSFRQFIARQQELTDREQIQLVPIEVGKGVYADRLRSSLHALISEWKVDALWMLNDNELIKSTEYLDQTWRAELRKAHVPLVVGVPNLVNPRTRFGSIAVVPDHEALGFQTANLIFDLADNGWRADEHPIELPISTKTVADVKQLREEFGLKDDALQHIDRVLEYE